MNLSEITIKQLIDLITVQKKYQPGDKLPNESMLAEDLGVSRNTIRSAVRYLIGQGVLEIKIGRGTYVAETSKIDADFGFNQLQYLHLKLKDLYEMRLMLEPKMAYYAAIRATDEEMQHILELGSKLQGHGFLGFPDDAWGNQLFHTAIAKATHNEFCANLAVILNEALVKAFTEAGKVQAIENFYMDHQMIMDYLERRDPEGAQLAMDLHMKNSMKEYLL